MFAASIKGQKVGRKKSIQTGHRWNTGNRKLKLKYSQLNFHHIRANRRNHHRDFVDNLIFHPLRSFSRPSLTKPRCIMNN